MRTIIIGDIHGCRVEFEQLLYKLRFAPGDDRLILTGDLMDRGPDPVGVVQLARDIGAEVVIGNHDEKHIRFGKHELVRKATGKKNPMRAMAPDRQAAYAQLEAAGLVPWVASWPVFLAFDGWVVVHAGLRPGTPLEAQKPSDCIHIRHVDLVTGKPASLTADLQQPPGTVRWAERWQGPQSVVYGHDVVDADQPRVDLPAPNVRCIGIDTGCVFGGTLTALVMPQFEFVQVPALHAYSPRVLPHDSVDD